MDDNELQIVEEPVGQETEGEKETAVAPEEEKGGSRFPTQTVLTIRTIVGAYVLYLAYQIITSDNEVTIPMWVAVAVFIVAGVALVIMSIKHFICGEYEGGKKDI